MPYTRKIGRQKSINIAEGGASICFHINCRGALLYPIAIFILVAIQLYSNSKSITVSQLKYYYSFSGSGNATVISGGEEGKSSFFWEASDNCHAVDNICYDAKNEKWFYFENSEQHQDGAFRQPSMVLLMQVMFTLMSRLRPPPKYQNYHNLICRYIIIIMRRRRNSCKLPVLYQK